MRYMMAVTVALTLGACSKPLSRNEADAQVYQCQVAVAKYHLKDSAVYRVALEDCLQQKFGWAR